MANIATANSTTISAQIANTTSYISLVAACAVSTAVAGNAPAYGARRGKLYDILVGTNGTPADNSMEYCVQRFTTASASVVYSGYVSSVAIADDPADTVIATAIWVNSTTEANFTFTAAQMPWYVGVNQRASYRWVAAPGSEIVWPATSCAGIALRSKSASGYTGTATGAVMAQEQ